MGERHLLTFWPITRIGTSEAEGKNLQPQYIAMCIYKGIEEEAALIAWNTIYNRAFTMVYPMQTLG
jgi:hypothetical protein